MRGVGSPPGAGDGRTLITMNGNRIEVGYGIAGLVIGAVILLISADLLTGGRIAAVFGKPPARLSVVPRETSEEGESA
jgi:hypothetical protein